MALGVFPGVVPGVLPGVEDPIIVAVEEDWVDSVFKLLMLAHRGNDRAPVKKGKTINLIHAHGLVG